MTTVASASSASSIVPTALPGHRDTGPCRVAMVCAGDTCRSATIEVALRDRLAVTGIPGSRPDGVTIASAGVPDKEHGDPIDSRARRILTEAGCGVGADDVSHATGSAIASHTAHRVTDAETTEANLLLAMTDSHWNVLQRHAVGLGTGPDCIRIYHELDPAFALQAEAVAAGGFSCSVLDVPDPWHGTMADFLDTLEVVGWVGNEFAKQLATPRN